MEGPRQGFEVLARLLNVIGLLNGIAFCALVGVIVGLVLWGRWR